MKTKVNGDMFEIKVRIFTKKHFDVLNNNGFDVNHELDLQDIIHSRMVDVMEKENCNETKALDIVLEKFPKEIDWKEIVFIDKPRKYKLSKIQVSMLLNNNPLYFPNGDTLFPIDELKEEFQSIWDKKTLDVYDLYVEFPNAELTLERKR